MERQLFWFLEEQYYHPSTVAEMEDSLGFCRIHAADYLDTGAGYRLGYLHLLMVQDVLPRLRRLRTAIAAGKEDPGGAGAEVMAAIRALQRRGLCVVCDDMVETERRTAHLLVQALRDPDIMGEIESYGKLCSTHFPMAAEVAPPQVLSLLIQVQAKGLMAAEGNPNGPPAEPPSVVEEPLVRPLATFRALAKAVGTDVKNNLRRSGSLGGSHRPPDGTDHLVPSLDSMIQLLEEARCPVCTLAQEALATYLAWYRAGIGDWTAHSPRRGDGFGRLCRDHLWEMARDADAGLLHSLGRFMLEEDRARVERSEAILNASDPPPPWRAGVHMRYWPRATTSWLKQMYRREARREAYAKWTLFPAPECPACQHVATITRQSLKLLDVMLQDGVVRGRYRGAWGLCMQHFADGIARPVEPAALETLVDVQIARLAALEWELEEFYRKSGWEVRYEPKGPERTAWARAIERFSGTDPRSAAPPQR